MAGIRKAIRKSGKRHIGAYVADELAARQWTERRFGVEADLPTAEVRAVLRGEVPTARALAGIARAFRTSPDLWAEVEEDFREREVMEYGQRGHWQ
jgi:transcriptional regulator with XRE-family HTH domain